MPQPGQKKGKNRMTANTYKRSTVFEGGEGFPNIGTTITGSTRTAEWPIRSKVFGLGAGTAHDGQGEIEKGMLTILGSLSAGVLKGLVGVCNRVLINVAETVAQARG